MKVRQWLKNTFLLTAILSLLPLTAFAAAPEVKTVPWVATNTLIPHDTYSGKAIFLKGTSDVQGANIKYIWDFGDGSPVATSTVSNQYIIEALHTYTGAVGTIFTATLTVQNTTTGETGSKNYFVRIQEKKLPVEVNIAIDEGLWTLHKAMSRSTSGGVIHGNWASWNGYFALQGANLNAFEVNGHLEDGPAYDPYTETVKRGMNTLFTYLSTEGTPLQALGNPDSNGNGFGIRVNQGNQYYQGGGMMDAIIASGTPDKLATTGPANVAGRKYKDIVQDMVDYYAYGQYDNASYGGWRYSTNEWPDNSACQWAAIGMIPAERNWGLTVPAWVKNANKNWLAYSQHPNGYFGYTDYNYIWLGPFATTASGMVQLVWNGIGRGTTAWDKAETFMRNNFDNTGGYGTYGMKPYNYYAMFSFTKSLLLHQPPITILHSTTGGVPDIDWYAAETAKGDPTNGIARTLVDAQASNGSWWSHSPIGQDAFETAWAIMMLKQTMFEAGAPVAVATATPNPGVAGQTINLSGSNSYHQDPTKTIVKWEWDLDNNLTNGFEATGPNVSKSWPAIGNYPVTLRVTDNNSPAKTADTTLTVVISIPPLAPTANAGGPYNFCPNKTWFLDGTKSSNPDNGQSEPGMPADFIKSYQWDLDGDNVFDDASSAQPDVTAFFSGKPLGQYLISLKVTDNTAASFPSSGFGDLSSTASAEVILKAATDPACNACTVLTARPKSGKVGLTWVKKATAASYNIYRSTVQGGPYIKIGTAPGSTIAYFDGAVTNGTTYYYVAREAGASGNEYCQSNEASAKPTL
ncbi:amylopullulanase [Geobacter sp. OR-1]|uniref:PKD domain-containing protein n=1 Tax=Geobacter sp. OR-1 TaxID=1266765 RepID=UPI000541DF92|nr:PKD domain-containing protein [Geobacter sp. OR-1]GAM10017.1 amylopullulanase [Geobacter sp. OR-1]